MTDDFTLHALDTLAAIYRLLGNHTSLPDPKERADFARSCDAWARHLLSGAPAPEGDAALVAHQEREWSKALNFLREWRVQEHALLDQQRREYAQIGREAIEILRQTVAGNHAMSDSILTALGRVDALLEFGPVAQARVEFKSVAEDLRSMLVLQNTQLEARFDSLHSRLETIEATPKPPASERDTISEKLAVFRRQLEERRSQVVLTDPLTKGYNRAAFDFAFPSYLDVGDATSQHLALMLLDIVGMKNINARMGADAGDRVIGAFAGALALTFMRSDDFVARYSGDKFVVLAFIAQPEDGQLLLGRLAERLDALPREQTPGVRPGCRGAVVVREPDEEAGDFMRRARAALATAKRNKPA